MLGLQYNFWCSFYETINKLSICNPSVIYKAKEPDFSDSFKYTSANVYPN